MNKQNLMVQNFARRYSSEHRVSQKDWMIFHMPKPNIKRKQKTFIDAFKRFHSTNAREAVVSPEKVFKYIKRSFIQVNNQ